MFGTTPVHCNQMYITYFGRTYVQYMQIFLFSSVLDNSYKAKTKKRPQTPSSKCCFKKQDVFPQWKQM